MSRPPIRLLLGGTSPSTASSARAERGTRRRAAIVFGYGVSTPSAKRRCTMTAAVWRAMSRRSSATHLFVRSPVSAAKAASGAMDRPELGVERVDLLRSERKQLLALRLGVAAGIDRAGDVEGGVLDGPIRS
jgi:hypothetical protein